ncbi:hypothetical protein [Streptomyces murinus]|uniref:hypothetical protein n=1 Tax=Streptomyces murinus TaxID=33900 RepID=UPI003F45708B
MRVDPDVLGVIKSAIADGPALRLPCQLDSKLYKRTDQVLRVIGGEWNRYKRAHIFPVDAAEAISDLLITCEVITEADRGYFSTPAPVVGQLLELAELTPGCEVLEPSAGRGAIAELAAARGAVVDCIELDADRADHIRSGGYARRVTTADFLSVPVRRRYQRAIMNPPFSKRQDIQHVERALRFVQPGGLVVAVMIESLSFRTDRVTKDFLARVREARGTITELPDNAFPGRRVRTAIVVIPVREAPLAPPFNLAVPRPEHFTARPRAVQQSLFIADEPTAHDTAALPGFGFGAPPAGGDPEIDPNTGE